uniref:Uncharacterized protein n=1 Tax=Arundo donax TaxID=35708 RepID=A0A0A8Z386_ARUDO
MVRSRRFVRRLRADEEVKVEVVQRFVGAAGQHGEVVVAVTPLVALPPVEVFKWQCVAPR